MVATIWERERTDDFFGPGPFCSYFFLAVIFSYFFKYLDRILWWTFSRAAIPGSHILVDAMKSWPLAAGPVSFTRRNHHRNHLEGLKEGQNSIHPFCCDV